MLTAAPHPQADKLQVLSVDAGDGPVQVVCGAPNARAGMTGVFGLPGATVPANGMVLRVAAIRGVEFNGMMCSTRELELGDDHDGMIELSDDAPVGADYAGLRRARRRGHRRERAPQSPRLHGRARDRARPRGCGAGDVEATGRSLSLRREAGRGRWPRPRHPHRGHRRLPRLLWPDGPRRDERPRPRLDGPPPACGRAEADQRLGRHHQFRLRSTSGARSTSTTPIR